MAESRPAPGADRKTIFASQITNFLSTIVKKYAIGATLLWQKKFVNAFYTRFFIENYLVIRIFPIFAEIITT
jgi:hypothetical protein